MKKQILLFLMIFGLGITAASAQTGKHQAAIDAFCNIMDKVAVKAQDAKTMAEYKASFDIMNELVNKSETLAIGAGLSDPLTAADKTRIKAPLSKLIMVAAKITAAEQGIAGGPEEAALFEAMVPTVAKAMVDQIVDKSDTLADIFYNMSHRAM